MSHLSFLLPQIKTLQPQEVGSVRSQSVMTIINILLYNAGTSKATTQCLPFNMDQNSVSARQGLEAGGLVMCIHKELLH